MERALLSALNVYWTWHSPGFLAGKGLIPPDWAADDFRRTAESLEAAGQVTMRFSPDRNLMMYRITLAGQARLAEMRGQHARR